MLVHKGTGNGRLVTAQSLPRKLMLYAQTGNRKLTVLITFQKGNRTQTMGAGILRHIGTVVGEAAGAAIAAVPTGSAASIAVAAAIIGQSLAGQSHVIN